MDLLASKSGVKQSKKDTDDQYKMISCRHPHDYHIGKITGGLHKCLEYREEKSFSKPSARGPEDREKG